MLTAVHKKWFSYDLIVNEGSETVAEMDLSSWREKGVLTIQGVEYRVYREGMISGDFILEAHGSVVARAEKPSAFYRTFEIAHEGTRHTLQAESALRRTFLLLQGERRIGSVSPEGIFKRGVIADLPPDLPLAVRVFVIWLVVIMWKRSDSSGAAA